MTEQASIHPQRLKMDGSSDSICLNCLGTITEEERINQQNADLRHICHPSFSVARTPSQPVQR